MWYTRPKAVVAATAAFLAAVAASGDASAAASSRAAPAAAPYVFVFSQILSTRGPLRVWETTADGSRLRNVTPRSENWSVSPRWSPDGSRLAVSSVVAPDLTKKEGIPIYGDLMVMNPAGIKGARISAHDCSWGIGWVPGGGWIACAVNGRPDGSLFVRLVPTIRGRVRLIAITGDPQPTEPDVGLNSVDWSPRGDQFVVDDYHGGVYLVAANGAVIATIDQTGTRPRWSPDGQWILFVDRGSLLVSSPIGNNKQTILDVPILDAIASAAWSPDGKQIAYIGTTGLHVVTLATGEDRLVNQLSRLCQPLPQHGCTDLDWRR